MKNLFNTIELRKPKKNYFDLTHDVKFSTNMGELTPILTMECVPGDKFDISAESIIRFAPMVAPIMHRIDVSIHYFFVPNRILWPNWEKFITNDNGFDSNPVAPYIQYSTTFLTDSTYVNAKSVRFLDYLGVPPIPTGGVTTWINALPMAAYQCIYNEYYRDQNLIDPIDYKLTDGNNTPSVARGATLTTLRNRCWEHDYFTSSLPWAQKGTAVDIPLGSISGNAPVYYESGGVGTTTLSGTNGSPVVPIQSSPTTSTDLFASTNGLKVNPTTINDLRRAYRLQEWLEKNARGGTRYIESILSHFGVKSSDSRLQRPEYICGVKTPVVVSEVLNTSATTSAPQGNMAGHGISVSSGRNGSYYCEEHGYIIGIMSVMPKTAYQQGMPRTFLKADPLDFYWPSFANIGEQPVFNQEIYAYSGSINGTFGYVPRYAEYKYMPSRVAGEFRTTLDYWHMGRIFSSAPALNAEFVTANPTTRIFAVEDPGTQHLYCHVLNKISAVRPMPKYGTPTI